MGLVQVYLFEIPFHMLPTPFNKTWKCPDFRRFLFLFRYFPSPTYLLLFNRLSPLTNIKFISLVCSCSGVIFYLSNRIAATSAALLFYPRFALISIILSHRKQKYLPYMVVIINFVNFCCYYKVLALPKAITFTYRYRRP